MGQDVRIAEIIPDAELPVLLDIIRQSFLTVTDKFGITRENAPTYPAFMTLEVLKKTISSGLVMFGLYDDEKMIGCVGIEDSGNGAFFIKRLAVSDNYRHKGYGRMLVDFALSIIKEKNGKKASIGMVNENTVLKEWYIGMGFVPVEVKSFSHLSFNVCLMDREI